MAGRTAWPRSSRRIEPELQYANLAVRGSSRARCARRSSTPRWPSSPTSSRVLAGLNDMLRRKCDVAAVIGELDGDGRARCASAGADVILFTLPDPVPINPLAKTAAARAGPASNDAIRELSARRGDVPGRPRGASVSSDRRLWDEDRLHANPEGHRRIAVAAAARDRAPGHRHVLDHRLPGPLGPPHAPLARGLVRALLHAVADPAPARPLLGRRAHGQAPGARAASESKVCHAERD